MCLCSRVLSTVFQTEPRTHLQVTVKIFTVLQNIVIINSDNKQHMWFI